MRVADFLVSNRIRRASAFECDRVGNVHGMYRRPFSLAQNRHHLANGDVRFCIHLSAGAGFCQATPDGLYSVCPPPSYCLRIIQIVFGRFASVEPWL
jgi:hypothetical protein